MAIVITVFFIESPFSYVKTMIVYFKKFLQIFIFWTSSYNEGNLLFNNCGINFTSQFAFYLSILFWVTKGQIHELFLLFISKQRPKKIKKYCWNSELKLLKLELKKHQNIKRFLQLNYKFIRNFWGKANKTVQNKIHWKRNPALSTLHIFCITKALNWYIDVNQRKLLTKLEEDLLILCIHQSANCWTW